MRKLARFCVEFVVGDDWRVAAGVAGTIAVAAVLVAGGVNAWWVLPVAVPLLLWLSLRREARRVSP